MANVSHVLQGDVHNWHALKGVSTDEFSNKKINYYCIGTWVGYGHEARQVLIRRYGNKELASQELQTISELQVSQGLTQGSHLFKLEFLKNSCFPIK